MGWLGRKKLKYCEEGQHPFKAPEGYIGDSCPKCLKKKLKKRKKIKPGKVKCPQCDMVLTRDFDLEAYADHGMCYSCHERFKPKGRKIE